MKGIKDMQERASYCIGMGNSVNWKGDTEEVSGMLEGDMGRVWGVSRRIRRGHGAVKGGMLHCSRGVRLASRMRGG